MAVSIRVEMLRHEPDEDTVRVLAVRPSSRVSLTTFIGQEKKVIVNKVMFFHWLEVNVG